MDWTPVLEGMANGLISLPENLLEQQLVSYDVLIRACGESSRGLAAALLKKAAAAAEPERRARLEKAASAVEAGEPCALTPQGWSAAQVAGVTASEWAEMEPKLAPAPGPDTEEEEDDDADLESAVVDAASLPQLPVRYFFSGLDVRVMRNFTDARGRILSKGQRLGVLSVRAEEESYYVSLLTRSMTIPRGEIARNRGNQWFEPVMTRTCIGDLYDAIARELREMEKAGDKVGVLLAFLEAPKREHLWTKNLDAVRLTNRNRKLGCWMRLFTAAAR